MKSTKPFIDSFYEEFEKYARKGLERACAQEASQFRVDWGDMPFFCRAYNLSNYSDQERGGPYEDSLELPRFPFQELRNFSAQSDPQLADVFFNGPDRPKLNNKKQEEDWWCASFDSGSDAEAAEWIMLMVDDCILSLESSLQKESQFKKIAVTFCGHDGQFPRGNDYYLKNIAAIRKLRSYKVDLVFLKDFLSIFTKNIHEKWLKK